MYIAIEGVIGVGKTTLAQLLKTAFNTELLLEAFEENPFLSDFYADRQAYAFQTQIFFLLSRYRQQSNIDAEHLADNNLIADYTFQKDALFARLNLQGDELATYHQVHSALAERIHPPDLIVYLRVDTDVAMQRIAQRDRPYERNMAYSYINDLNKAYEAFMKNEVDQNVLVIDSNPLDFVANNDHLDGIADRIRATLGIPPYQQKLPLGSG
ncbi:MAG: deoxynucleoside kinase [Chloroflexi bacterium]|nr:deoxynucleoside kinase [Chloroflexota bacterium]